MSKKPQRVANLIVFHKTLWKYYCTPQDFDENYVPQCHCKPIFQVLRLAVKHKTNISFNMNSSACEITNLLFILFGEEGVQVSHFPYARQRYSATQTLFHYFIWKLQFI